MNTMITDAAVEAAYRAAASVCAEQDGESIDESLFTDAEHMAEMRPILRAAIEAALPHLQPPELSETSEFDPGLLAWMKDRGIMPDAHEGVIEMDEVVQALSDYENDLLRANEDAHAARQPVGEAVANIPQSSLNWLNGKHSGADATRRGDAYSRPVPGENTVPVYSAPPAQRPAQVDLGQFRGAVKWLEWTHRDHGAVGLNVYPDAERHAEALRLLALIDSQGNGNG